MRLCKENFVTITYPDPAPGWKDGIYYERCMCVLPPVEEYMNSDEHGMTVYSECFTETEETGFGVYRYVETTAIQVACENSNYQITIGVHNPGVNALKLSILADDVEHKNIDVLLPGETKDIEFHHCCIYDQLTLRLYEDNGTTNKQEAKKRAISICSLDLVKTPTVATRSVPTLYLASDSTVQTYESYYYPQTGWGQVLYRFFHQSENCKIYQSKTASYPQCTVYELKNLVIENRSIGARSCRSFIEEGKFDQLLSVAAEGDYLFIQWAHNDATAARPNRYVHVEDFEHYIALYINACRARGIIPVLVTAITMRNCGADNIFHQAFAAYCEEMVRIGKKYHVPVLDLSMKTLGLVKELGPEESKSLYLWVNAGVYPDGAYAGGVSDNCHLQEYGAMSYAKLLTDCLKEDSSPELAFLRDLLAPCVELRKEDYVRLAPIPEVIDPLQPRNLAMQEMNINGKTASFLLSFESVENAVSYKVYKKGSVDFDFSLLRSVSASEKEASAVLPFVLPSYDVFRIYVVPVFAKNVLGTPSKTIEFRTQP